MTSAMEENHFSLIIRVSLSFHILQGMGCVTWGRYPSEKRILHSFRNKKKKKLNFIFKVVYLDLKLGDLKDV